MASFRGGMIAALLLLLALPAAAQIEERWVQFAPGTSSATVEGQIQDDEIVDHLLNARAGQAANISMVASPGIGYFNLIAPGETDVAFHIGSRDGNQFEGVLPESGEYRIRVYLMGNQAPTSYRLEMIVFDTERRSAPATARDNFLETDFYEVKGVSPDDVLNLRDGPSTAQPVVAGFENGTILRNAGACEVHGGTRWCPVEPTERAGLRGWVSARYLREPGPRSGAGPAPIVTNDYADGLMGGPDFWQVTGVLSSLNIRSRASTTAPIVARVPPGTVLRNRGCFRVEGRRWCEVDSVHGGPSGWAAGEYLREASGVDPARPWDARDSATGFHATAMIPCARYPGQPMGQCDAGVRRTGPGAAEVVVMWNDGGTRTIGFANGEAAWSDAPLPIAVRREADLSFVSIGDERVEIFDALPFGG